MGLFHYFRRKHLQNLARKTDRILREELVRHPDLEASVRVYDARNVGVQGDVRTYERVAEISLRLPNGLFFWESSPSSGYTSREGSATTFIGRLSTRITNEVRGINRVYYCILGN